MFNCYVVFYLFILLIILKFFYQKRKQKNIKVWKKSLNLFQHESVFNQLYKDCNGFLLSQHARQSKDGLECIYGEIEFLPFVALLSLAKIDHQTIFYDLGSGIGKAILACSLVYPVKKAVGIEIFPELQLCAVDRVIQLALNPSYEEVAKKMEFLCADFFKTDLNEATLIFINSTTLFGELWTELSLRLNNLPKLQTLITTSKPLLAPNFFEVDETEVKMSWGIVNAFIHRKKRNSD